MMRRLLSLLFAVLMMTAGFVGFRGTHAPVAAPRADPCPQRYYNGHPENCQGFVVDGSPQPDDTKCVGSNREIAECMLARWGWAGPQWSCMDYRISDIENRDWDTQAGAPSAAYGIPQAKPGYKMGGPNYVEVPGGGYQGNWYVDPLIQVAWMRVYVRDRYGAPCNIPRSGGY